ncbi:MAG: DUF374 domain-containing protein [Desulfofustis sp.]|nr:DUF374 domain-containing protein [Desulfofustis sp.]
MAALYACFFRILRRSWRTRDIDLQALDILLAQDRRVLAAFWHGRYLSLFPLLEGYPATIITSCSFRGQIIAHLCTQFGFRSIFVSDHESATLYRRLIRELQTGGCLATAVDGPLGPFHHIRDSLMILAARLDLAIIPLSVAVKPSIVLTRRWDELEIPLPFSRILVCAGEPINLPEKLQIHQAAAWAKRLRRSMEENERVAADRLIRSSCLEN